MKCLVGGDVRVVTLTKPLLLVGFVFRSPDEFLYFSAQQKPVGVRVVAHEIDWERAILLLLTKLRRDRLELFDQSITRMITGHIIRAVVGDFDLIFG